MNADLSDITGFMDELLDTKNVQDWGFALNGLQLSNMGRVASIGAAVDAGEGTLRKSEAAGIDLLLVHHGLFWGGVQPLTGAAYRKVSMAVRADMAIYSSHLPLDLHPALGNNVLLAQALGLGAGEPFFMEKGRLIGRKAVASLPLDELVVRMEKAVGGAVRVFPGGGEQVRNVGIVTGGAGGEVARAAAEGVDTFISGEGPHHSAILAEELGVNMLLGGHYATETFGVKALAALVGEKFGLPWQFIDHPTGL